MIKKPNNSGWILCPSKSYPGKFYYFNVLNGDAAWCLNEKEKKVLKKDFTIQKVNENHLYPEPITPPDHPSPRGSNYNRPIPTCLPKFGKAVFPKYIANDKEEMKMVCTPIQMLQLVTNTKKMLDQNTRPEDNIKVHTHTIPLTKRFENKINEGFGSINYLVTNQPKDLWNSTNICSNIGKHCSTDNQYNHKIFTKPILKESKLNKFQYKNNKDVWCKSARRDSIQFHCNKVKNPKANMLMNLDINDLRYVLRAKRRKSVEISDVDNKVNEEDSTFNDAMEGNFNIRDKSTFHTKEKYISEESPYTNNDNQQVWYLVVDLDVLLEDYDAINRYIDKDENCRLYVPSVVHNELKSLCMGEHKNRSRVIAARKLQRHLGSNLLKLNIPENEENTKIHQIINCCLEIMQRISNVVLVTKDNELIYTAKLYKIQVYHINYIKSSDQENIFIHTNKNLFLQNTDDFDPFSLSKIVGSENNCTQNIPGPKESLLNKISYMNVNNSDVSEIIMSTSKLKINDKILNIKKKIKNDLFENKMVRSNYNLPAFHINETPQSHSKEVIVNRTLYNNKKNNINLENNPDNYRNKNIITKPFNFDNNEKIYIFEGMLEKFKIKNYTMENNIYVRFDEWVCFYEQILEEFLYIVLQKNLEKVYQPPPWFLHEGLECLKEIYTNNKYIINIIEKLLYYYECSENGTNIKPYNFMKLFGCGFYLVEALEKTSPVCISDIKDKLIYLKDMLECPVEDLVVDTPKTYNPEDKQTDRCHFVKNPSDVLDYLKKHFSEWKNYNEDDNTNEIKQEVHEGNIKVVRTCGRDLKQFTISKSKCLSFIKETDAHNDVQSNDYPKVIRNIKLLDKYEKKIKNKDICVDYPEIAETNSSISLNNENNIINGGSENNDCEIESLNNDFSINDINDSTKDSGFDSNGLHAYHLVRNFLSELCSSFKTIHKFIEESIKAYNEDIPEENKKELYEKANKTHKYITKIIDKLKIIIQRESLESSPLKALIIKAGRDDTRTNRYRPVVMKCLEQATILENSLKLLLAITNEEVLSVSSDENIPFINIYE